MIKIGTDIIEISRIKNFVNKNIKKLDRIFTNLEIEYSFSKKNPYEHFAVRFAGKEAVKKAYLDNLNFRSIEIFNDEFGKPNVKINNIFQKNISISLSHSRFYAVAFVIIN